MRYFNSILLFFFIALHVEVIAQNFPVQSTTQLIPPYSVYLTDYASPESQKLRVILVQRDLTQPSYQLRLVVNIELNGNIIMRTSRLYRPAPITLDPGIPTVISGADLFSYLDSRNLDFVGYSRDQYERTKALPEGSYRISFTAYDYQRQEVQVSNEGSSFYWLAKNEPPLINFPACGTRVPLRDPQQIVFSWLPRNTTSPNSAADTQYEFALYESRPAGRNPNDVVLTTPPIFRTTTDYTQLVFGPAEPLLLEGMSYVWRVQAQDKNGRDYFRNNGYSEVCYFTYGGADPGFEVGTVQGLQAQGESERKAKIWWQTGVYDTYRIEYRKVGKDFEWFKSEVKGSELKLFDLEPNTEYEARMQASKEGIFGPYTDIVKFKTTPMRVAQCGQATPQWPNTPGKPLLSLITGMYVNARGFEMSIVAAEPNGGDGWYKGTGRVTFPYLAGASFATQFQRIYIDEDRNVVNGRIDFITKGVAAMAEEQLTTQTKRKKEAKQKENREQWANTDFYEKVFKYDNAITSVVVGDNDNMVTYDNLNTMSVNTDIAPILASNPGKAIVIEDKNGDQWVVQKDKDTGKTTVTKVEGGGLMPGDVGPLAKEDSNIIKKALRELDKEYSDKLRSYSQSTDIATYSTAKVVVYFADETGNKEGYRLIASGLQVKNEKVLDYLAKAREQKIAEADQIKEVKGALLAVLTKSITDIYNTLDGYEQEITKLIGDEHSTIYRRGSGPMAEEGLMALPTCFGTDKRQLAIIKDYTSISKLPKSKTADQFLKNVFTSFAGALVEYTPGASVTSTLLCSIILSEATEYYTRANLEDAGFVTAGATLAGCALDGFNRGIATNGTIELKAYTALLQTGLCLTEQDKCAGQGYWTQFGYGATNALLQELDVAAMVDGVLFIVGTQLKNKFECVKKGGLIYLVVTADSYEEAVHVASKCLLGVDMTVTEWKVMYGKAKDYISKNWDNAYLHGQATVFVATILVPYTKLSKATKLKLLNKLKGNSKFINKVDELERLSKLADEGGDVGKVMDDLARRTDEIIDVARATERQLDDAFANLQSNPPFKYSPNTLEHKAERWAQYKVEKGSAAKDYDAWSNLYNANMTKATKAHQAADEVIASVGWGKREVTVQAGTYTRRMDIADIPAKKGIEVKSYESGKVYATEAIKGELNADKFLVNNDFWEIEWMFKGCEPSQPLRTLLEQAGIKIKLIP